MDSRIFNYIKNGIPIIIADDFEREFEGDLMIAAEKAYKTNLAFMIAEARGLMCVPCNGKILDRLQIPMMVENSTDRFTTPFTVSVDAAEGISTGMSASDRLATLGVMLNEKSYPEELARPGHLFPLRPRDNLLSERRGHTEASIALLRMAGMKEIAVISEIIDYSGDMIKGDNLERYSVTHAIPIVSVEEIAYAFHHQSL